MYDQLITEVEAVGGVVEFIGLVAAGLAAVFVIRRGAWMLTRFILR